MPFNTENIASESNFLLLKDSINKYVVKPANAFGFGGLVFDVEGETAITTTSEITDHFVEDNSAIQDHIATRPLKLTLTGFIGELVRDEGNEIAGIAQKAVQKLGTLTAYLPAISASAQQVKSIYEGGIENFDFQSTLGDATDLFSLVKNLNPTSGKQQQAYLYFKSLKEQKILISVQTPFEFLQNMAIETISAVQEENTNDISSFTITLKQIRFASTTTVKFDKKDYDSKAGSQRSEIEDKGKAQGEDVSLLGKIKNGAYDIFKGIFE
tara:strand:- start:1284 stop:2090 length:807 start_codon:yes stop_codon:yes gene_type:complete